MRDPRTAGGGVRGDRGASLARVPGGRHLPGWRVYLTVRFDLNGYRTAGGETLETDDDIRRFLLKSAGTAIVPFQSLGFDEDTGWFRLCVSAATPESIRASLLWSAPSSSWSSLRAETG